MLSTSEPWSLGWTSEPWRLGWTRTAPTCKSLLRSANQRQEIRFLDDTLDDEDRPYEAYCRSSTRAEELDPNEEELEGLLREMVT